MQNFVLENELFPVENGERLCVIQDDPRFYRNYHCYWAHDSSLKKLSFHLAMPEYNLIG